MGLNSEIVVHDNQWEKTTCLVNHEINFDKMIRVFKTQEALICEVAYREFNHVEKYVTYEDSISQNLNVDEAKSLRDWLVQQLPFSKQELVDLMGQTAKGGNNG